ncbi:MAG: hypothetical protein ACT4P4_25275, partial [Betaproteobacteria bacterium]
MDPDDRSRLLEFALKARVSRLQSRNAPLLGRELCLAAAPATQRLQGPRVALAPPGNQMRAVQPLAPQQRPNRPRTTGPVSLAQHRELVRRAELPALRHRAHLRIGRGRRALIRRLPPFFVFSSLTLFLTYLSTVILR